VVAAALVEEAAGVVEAALVDEGAALEDAAGLVDEGAGAALLLVALEEDEAGAGAEPEPEPPGLTTEVVMSPLSMYTPEKFQSSWEPSLVRRSTPRCQSAPLESVDAATGPAIFSRASAPVEW